MSSSAAGARAVRLILRKLAAAAISATTSIRRDGKKLGKEIVFAAKVRHWRNSAKTIVAARTPEAGRQPGRH